MTDTGWDDVTPPIYPGPHFCTDSLRYAERYQELNEYSHLTKWSFETYGQRASREQKGRTQ